MAFVTSTLFTAAGDGVSRPASGFVPNTCAIRGSASWSSSSSSSSSSRKSKTGGRYAANGISTAWLCASTAADEDGSAISNGSGARTARSVASSSSSSSSLSSPAGGREGPDTNVMPQTGGVPPVMPAVALTRQHSSMTYSGKGDATKHLQMQSKIVHAGTHRDEYTTDPLGRSVINVPVYHASTIVFPNVATKNLAMGSWPLSGLSYGRHGTPTHWALEEAYAAIEGGDNACVVSSGLAACNASLLAFLQSGDHVLMADAVYDPTRTFCDKFLGRFGVSTTYFDPVSTPAEIEALIQPGKTKVLFLESPGSLSFEVTDVPALAEAAHRHDVTVVMDNTYGTTLFKPFEAGVDVSLCAATKYIAGHSDLLMGLIACTSATYRRVKRAVMELGCPPGADDCYLALRGMRTLGVRLRQHEQNSVLLAKFLEARPEVKRVMHPMLPSHPQHQLFMRDFAGANGLFGFQLVEGFSQTAVDAFIDSLKLFGIGFSWGGYESLVLQTDINAVRSATTFKRGDGYGQTLRMHAGLEDPNDLIADVAQAFEAMHAVNETDPQM